jgi:hypothetical protein
VLDEASFIVVVAGISVFTLLCYLQFIYPYVLKNWLKDALREYWETDPKE